MHILKIFSLKSVFNRLYRLSPNGHQLSDGEIKKLQKCLLCIYSDIYEVCKKYEIKPFSTIIFVLVLVLLDLFCREELCLESFVIMVLYHGMMILT